MTASRPEFVVPMPPVTPPRQPLAPHWEYHVEHAGTTTEAIESFLYRLGQKGWELVGFGPTIANPAMQRFVFKRPLPLPPASMLKVETTPGVPTKPRINERWRHWCGSKARWWQRLPRGGITTTGVWNLRPLAPDRGAGRTRAAAEYVANRMITEPGLRVCVISPYPSASYLPALMEALPQQAGYDRLQRVVRCELSEARHYRWQPYYSAPDFVRHMAAIAGLKFDLLWLDECPELERLRHELCCPVVIS
jgi:hypothetical protein